MGNQNLIPYETIVRATEGEPEAVDEVLQYYSRRIHYAAIENGHVNPDTEDSKCSCTVKKQKPKTRDRPPAPHYSEPKTKRQALWKCA